MWTDEVFSFHAARMIIEKGEPIYDSGLYYGRATLYHQLLALSMSIFGVSELGSRIINIPFLVSTSIIIGVFTYQLLKDTKLRNKSTWISFAATILYYISNFSVAMLRETRMYAMSTFLFVLSVFLVYKAMIKPPKWGLVKLKFLDLELNVLYSLLFIPIFYLAYLTQPINILLGLGLLIFFGLNALLGRRYKQILLSILILLLAFLVTYLKFDSWNLLVVFKELSPDWANTLTPLYYSIITVRNLPFVLVTAPIAIYFLLKRKDVNILYLGSVIVSLLVFLSLQQAQHERYWQGVIPLILILSVYIFVLLWQNFKQKWARILLSLIIGISFCFHTYLSVKEFLEINTYTPTSLSLHKKLQYNNLFTYLDSNLLERDILITDFHSAYTLYEKGYNIDYLVLADDNVNWTWGERDLYFDIPLLKASDLNSTIQGSDGYIVTRDLQIDVNTDITQVGDFLRPQLYKF